MTREKSIRAVDGRWLLGRRRLLQGAGAAGLGLLGAALIGCDDDDDDDDDDGGTATPTSAAATAAPTEDTSPVVYGGTMFGQSVPNTSTYGSLDPAASFTNGQFTWASTNQLVRRDLASAELPPPVVPDAALSWEQPDAETYVFQLAPNVKFHNISPVDGRLATSEDVKFSIERISFDLPGFVRREEFRAVTVSTPDKLTIQFKTVGPLAAFMSQISTAGTVILPVELEEVEGDPVIASGKPIPGTGPFLNDEYVPDRVLRHKRNPEYWKKDQNGNRLPYLDGIEERFFTDLEARRLAMRAGDTDYTHGNFNHAGLEDLEDAGINIVRRGGTFTTWLLFNIFKEPWTDARVRRAAHQVMDRQAIVDLVFEGVEAQVVGPGGLRETLHGPLAIPIEELQTMPAYRVGQDKQQDFKDATDLLSAAGFAPGDVTIQLLTDQVVLFQGLISELQQAQWEAFGFKVDVHILGSLGEGYQMVAGGEWEQSIFSHYAGGQGFDPDSFLSQYFFGGGDGFGGGRNWGYNSPRYDELLEIERQQVDVNERAATIRELVTILEEDVPRVPTLGLMQPASSQPWMHGAFGIYGSQQEKDPDTIWKDK